MQKFIALLQLLLCLILVIVAAAILVNLVLISTRPETISVVNTLIGQGVLIIALMAFCRILYKKGLTGLKATNESRDKPGSSA